MTIGRDSRDAALELALCRLHQRAYCVPVSSGTVGLALTIDALDLKNAPVAIPSGVCLNVPLAIKYAGAAPIYCDIDSDTLGLSQETVSAANVAVAGVVAVHAYGNACDVGALASYCSNAAIPMIEDVAAAQGLTVGDRPAGSFGTASVLSFGRGKIIDIGAGGAVLTDDAALARRVRESHSLLSVRDEGDTARLDAFSSWHTTLYNHHYGDDLEKHAAPFIVEALSLRDATLTKFDWNHDAVVRELGDLPGKLARRIELSEYLFAGLESRADGISCQRGPLGSALWRANVFIPKHRDQILRALLARGSKISSWYPPAQQFLEPGWALDTPVAERVGEEILNVWVNDEVDRHYLDDVIEKIASLQNECQRHQTQRGT